MKKYIYTLLIILLATGCRERVSNSDKINSLPSIYPDYVSVTVPFNIAPLNFCGEKQDYECMDVIINDNKGNEIHENGKVMNISEGEWKQMLSNNKGDSIMITVSFKNGGKWKTYKPFPIFISKNTIDKWLTYRLIAPGYEIYSKMGIYQRDLTSFEQKPILVNTLVSAMCINCHTSNKTNPDNTSIHVRGKNGATIMIHDGKTEYLNTKIDSLLSACVYPYWHPSGKYIAYSLNNTRQSFHTVKDERIEVLDLASDVVVYHPSTHEILTSPLLMRKDIFETFPVFSPDGKKLYFCAADKKEIPAKYKEIRYNLYSISFDPKNGTFGDKIDTLINAEIKGKSISFPRPSYDGKYIMYTLSDYGNFSIWHKEADLWMYNIKERKNYPLTIANSKDTESFHNWSSNSKWFVFSSRRDDGLYTRLYIAGIDNKGNIARPFMLPQENPYSYYQDLEYSYNVPDFTNKPININIKQTEKKLRSNQRTNITIRK